MNLQTLSSSSPQQLSFVSSQFITVSGPQRGSSCLCTCATSVYLQRRAGNETNRRETEKPLASILIYFGFFNPTNKSLGFSRNSSLNRSALAHINGVLLRGLQITNLWLQLHKRMIHVHNCFTSITRSPGRRPRVCSVPRSRVIFLTSSVAAWKANLKPERGAAASRASFLVHTAASLFSITFCAINSSLDGNMCAHSHAQLGRYVTAARFLPRCEGKQTETIKRTELLLLSDILCLLASLLAVMRPLIRFPPAALSVCTAPSSCSQKGPERVCCSGSSASCTKV